MNALGPSACNNPTCTYHADCRVRRAREAEPHCACRECLNGCAKGHCPRTQSCQLRYRDTVKVLQVVKVADFHSADADCDASGAVDAATGDCSLCGVTADGCPRCSGKRFHEPGCPESDDRGARPGATGTWISEKGGRS